MSKDTWVSEIIALWLPLLPAGQDSNQLTQQVKRILDERLTSPNYTERVRLYQEIKAQFLAGKISPVTESRQAGAGPVKGFSVFLCRGCHVKLGLTTAKTLWVAAAMFTEPVNIICLCCGSVRRWQPLDNST